MTIHKIKGNSAISSPNLCELTFQCGFQFRIFRFGIFPNFLGTQPAVAFDNHQTANFQFEQLTMQFNCENLILTK